MEEAIEYQSLGSNVMIYRLIGCQVKPIKVSILLPLQWKVVPILAGSHSSKFKI